MHHNSLGQCHLTGSEQERRTLWEKNSVFVLLCFFFPPLADGLRSPECERRGMEARAHWKFQRTETRYFNTDTKVMTVLDHLHRMCQPGEHQLCSVFHYRKKSAQTKDLQSLSALKQSSIAHLICPITLDGQHQPRAYNNISAPQTTRLSL